MFTKNLRFTIIVCVFVQKNHNDELFLIIIGITAIILTLEIVSHHRDEPVSTQNIQPVQASSTKTVPHAP